MSMDTTSDSASSSRSSSSAEQLNLSKDLNVPYSIGDDPLDRVLALATGCTTELLLKSTRTDNINNQQYFNMLSHPMWTTAPMFLDGRMLQHQMPPNTHAPIRPQVITPAQMVFPNNLANMPGGIVSSCNDGNTNLSQTLSLDHQAPSAFRPVYGVSTVSTPAAMSTAIYTVEQPPLVTVTPATPVLCNTSLSNGNTAINLMLSPNTVNINNNNQLGAPNLVADPFSVEKYLDAISEKSADSPGSSSLSPRENASFEGNTVLCQVCGDKASGFHYGVHACEGCKGFFRRSIQSKLPYRPCTKNQQCSVLRINRNRCQFCRLKKCIAVGMSRDSVRFGRVPKKEKEKIRLEMQLAQSRSAAQQLQHETDDDDKLLAAVVTAHLATCQFTRDKMAPLMQHLGALGMSTASSQVACPLNPRAQTAGSHGDMSDRYEPAIRGVVTFAKSIPGFHLLSQLDQVTLLKAGIFEVLLLRLSLLFDEQARSVLLLDGSVYRRDNCPQNDNNNNNRLHSRFLVDSLFDYVERLNTLRLNDADLALYCAVALITPDRPGLRNCALVDRLQQRLRSCLGRVLAAHHPDQPQLYDQLIGRLPDLRTLNTLHQEKLLTFKINEQCSYAMKTEQMSPPASASTNSPQSEAGAALQRARSNAMPFRQPAAWSQTEAADSFDSGLGTRSMKATSSGSDTDSDHCHVSPAAAANVYNGLIKLDTSSIGNHNVSLRDKHQLVAQLLERKPQLQMPLINSNNNICWSVGAMDLSAKRAEPAHSSNSPKRRCALNAEDQPLNLSMKKVTR